MSLCFVVAPHDGSLLFKVEHGVPMCIISRSVSNDHLRHPKTVWDKERAKLSCDSDDTVKKSGGCSDNVNS